MPVCDVSGQIGRQKYFTKPNTFWKLASPRAAESVETPEATPTTKVCALAIPLIPAIKNKTPRMRCLILLYGREGDFDSVVRLFIWKQDFIQTDGEIT